MECICNLTLKRDTDNINCYNIATVSVIPSRIRISTCLINVYVLSLFDQFMLQFKSRTKTT